MGFVTGLEDGGALVSGLIRCTLINLRENLAFQDLSGGVLDWVPSSNTRVSILRCLVDGLRPARLESEICQHVAGYRRLGLVLSLIKASLIE